MAISVVRGRRALLAGIVVSAAMLGDLSPDVRALESDSEDPVDIIVLVDESASLSSAAVRAEKDALKEIISSTEIEDRGIRVGVLPFSSGEASPRRLDLCSLTEIERGAESRADLLKCADQITRQRRRGSADTDFATAIEAALSMFDRGDAAKVLLLLTDGKYDPDGDESISKTEQDELDAVLQQANNEKVSMWALGFGKADEKALSKYVAATALGDPSCAAKPEATIASQVQLAAEIREIIDHATCTGRVVGPVDPDFEFSVSPLLSRVTVQVSSESGLVSAGDVTVSNAAGERVCDDPESDFRGRWTCTERVSGQDGGIWKVTSTKGRKLTALVTWNGSIDVVAEGCVVKKNQTPETVVLLGRADGEPVNFEVDGNVNWPRVIVRATDALGRELRKTALTLDKERNDIVGVSEFPMDTKIDIEMDTTVPEAQRLLVRAHQISSCTIVAESVPTTTSPTTTSPSTTTSYLSPTTTGGPSPCPSGAECPPPPPPPPYWLFVLIGLGVIGAVVWYVRRRSQRFPDGSELTIRNRRNPMVFDTIGDISGKSKVYFDVSAAPDGTAEAVIVEGRSDARYVLTRNDSESVAIKSLFEPATGANDEDDDEAEPEVGEIVVVLNDDVFNPREADPPGSDGKSDQIFMRVNWPEVEDEFLEEDE